MIGLDTNVLLRLGDEREPGQRARAIALMRTLGAAGAFVNPIVLAEFAWTLARTYKLSRDEIVDRIEILLEAPEFVIAHDEEAERALTRFRGGPADFADYFLAEINRSAGCDATATFDGDALKSGDMFTAVLILP
jgi:predicted nucleic-acid-binding protein